MYALDKQNSLAGPIQNGLAYFCFNSRSMAFSCITTTTTTKGKKQGNVYRVTNANTLNKFLQMKSKLKKYEIAMGIF